MRGVIHSRLARTIAVAVSGLAFIIAIPAFAAVGTSIGTNVDVGGNLTVAGNSSLGTVIAGTWNGTAIAIADGGTGAGTAADARTNLGLTIGTDVQAYNANLAGIAGLTIGASSMAVKDDGGSWLSTSLTAAGRAILDDADAAAQRTTLGAAASGNNSDITQLSGLTGPIKGMTDLTSSNGSTYLYFTNAVAAVNWLNIYNAETGVSPKIAAAGIDANVDLLLESKGTGVVKVNGVQVSTSSATETLTNKTLTSPVISSISNTGTLTLPTSTGTVALTSDITKSAVGLGNVENTALSTWAGSSNIATVGTISTGTWQGSTVGIAYGGTNNTSLTTGYALTFDGTKIDSSSKQISDLVTLAGSETLTNKTLTSPVISYSTASVTAGTTQTQAGATALTGDINLVTTGNAGDGVVLPAASVGLVVRLVNQSGVAGKLYANGTDTIDSNAGATGVTLPANSGATCFVPTGVSWFCYGGLTL